MPWELEDSPNIDISVSSETLILKIKHTFFLFFLKNLQHFLHQKQKNFKVLTRCNKHELIDERLLLLVDVLFTLSHMV